MASSTWSSSAWLASGAVLHKHQVLYKPGGTYLHTFDIWVPKDNTNGSSVPEPGYVPERKGPWIVYIHGGAWRDPLVDSSSFESTALKILSNVNCAVAGIVSINYPLSSYPHHPIHPAPPRDPAEPIDVARTAKHPEHIISVISALVYLQNELGIAHNYILSGHSCGATLTFQVVMSVDRWADAVTTDVSIPKIRKPEVIVGLNGLYDLREFITNPPDSHKSLVSAYAEFTENAFGKDERIWQAVCPTHVTDWAVEWPEGRVVVVVQSKDDGLVPYSQTELMKERLAAHSKLQIVEMNAGGDHNDMWKQGDELAAIMCDVLSSYT